MHCQHYRHFHLLTAAAVAGEEPCDEVDACCKQHDDCVGGSSVLDAECHTDFVACLDQVMLSGSKGFSKTVSQEVVLLSSSQGLFCSYLMFWSEMFCSDGFIIRHVAEAGMVTDVRAARQPQSVEGRSEDKSQQQ
jgi:hypothetical protein